MDKYQHEHGHTHEHGAHCSCGHCHEEQEMQFADFSEEQWQGTFGQWQDFISGEGEELAELKEQVKAYAADEDSVRLRDCLELLSREDLLELIYLGKYAVDENLDTEAMISALEKEIMVTFRQFLQCMTMEDEYQLWAMVMNDGGPMLEILMEMWEFYQQHGFVYYFVLEDEAGDEVWCSIMPVELQVEFVDWEQDRENWLAQAEMRDLVLNVMSGLASIYGSYPLAQLQTIWKHIGHDEEIPAEILQQCCQLVEMGKNDLVIADEQIYWDEILLDQPVVPVAGYDYVLPTLDEIMAEVEGTAQELQSPVVREIEELFVKKLGLSVEQAKDAMQNIRYIVKMSADQQECMEFIDFYRQEHGIRPLKKAEKKQLEEWIAAWAQEVRQWAYRGHCPAERAK